MKGIGRKLFDPRMFGLLGTAASTTFLFINKSSVKDDKVPDPPANIKTLIGPKVSLPDHIRDNPYHVVQDHGRRRHYNYLSLVDRLGLSSFTSSSESKNDNNLVIAIAHGGFEYGRFRLDLFKPFHDPSNDTVEQILSLQKESGETNFYIFSCYSGSLINRIKRLSLDQRKSLGFKAGTKICTFGSHKHEILEALIFSAVEKIISQQGVIKDYGAFAAELSLELGITVKNLTFGEDGVAKEVKYNLHKYPEVWKRLSDKTIPAELTSEENAELIALEVVPKDLFFGAKQRRARLKVLKESEALYELYGDCSADLSQFPSFAFIESVVRGKIDRAQKWLDTGKVNIDHFGYGVPALIVASSGRDIKMMEFLLSKGANIDSVDINGSTALIHAIYSNDLFLTKYLLSKGADPHIVSKDGKSAFDFDLTLLEPIARIQEVIDNIPDLKEKIIVKCHAESSKHPLKVFLSLKQDVPGGILKILEETVKRSDISQQHSLFLKEIISDYKKASKVDDSAREIKTDLTFEDARKLLRIPPSSVFKAQASAFEAVNDYSAQI